MSNQETEILDPGLPIIDAHHHLIDSPGHSYSIDDYSKDCFSGHQIEGSVYIEVRQNYWKTGPEHLRPVGETEHVYRESDIQNSNICAGIVGFAELELGDRVDEVLDAHIEVGEGKFRGIRRGVYWSSVPAVYEHVSIKPPPELMLDNRFQEGFTYLEPKGLSFDAVLFHPQLSELAKLAKKFPNTTIILNHLGFKLGIGSFLSAPDETIAEWRKGLKLVAKCPNVMVKVGGLGMKIWGFEFRSERPSYQELAEAWRPIVEFGIETFGVERCIFESNYPVDAATTDFISLWNALKFIVKDYSENEKQKLFFDNANRIYRLGLAAGALNQVGSP